MSMNKVLHAANVRAFKLYAQEKPKDAVPSITYGAHSTSRDYAGNNMVSSRGNADDNLLCLSVNSGAQITRNKA